jgi:transposase InsO family protein
MRSSINSSNERPGRRTKQIRKIKVLRADNEGEYTSNDFKDFYKEAGIKRELTISYNPQQNGVVERKNRFIISSAKAMIHDQGLPMFL